MSRTRKQTHQMELPHSAEKVFAILHTPSAIRGWWGAARAIVIAREGGVWAAAWGSSEDDPDYVSAARIRHFEPPRRLVLADFEYYAKSGPLPFQADITTEFTLEAQSNGCLLRVVQDGFPVVEIADEFYAACEVGWRNTFDLIRRYLEQE